MERDTLIAVAVATTPMNRLEVLARNDLQERVAATPAIVDDTLYVRTESSLYAFAR